jgi:AcrR family transcriptional regulator
VSASRARTAGPFLDKATLVRAAADVADRDGWSQLTLSRVAEDVDRHVSSLYTHVDGLDALRRDVALLALDELADEVWRAAIGRSGGQALTAIATVERDFARAHRGRIAAINAFTGTSDPDFRAKGVRLAEPIRATLAGFGLDEDRVAVAHHVFSAAVRGLVQTETDTATGHDAADEALTQTVELFVTALESGDWPRPRPR